MLTVILKELEEIFSAGLSAKFHVLQASQNMMAGFGLQMEEYKNVKNSQQLYWKIIFCLQRIVRGK